LYPSNLDVYYCCDKKYNCKNYESPFLYYILMWILTILKIIIIGVIFSEILIKISKFSNKSKYDGFITNSFYQPKNLLTNFIPKFRKISNFTSNLLSILSYLLLLIGISFIYHFVPLNRRVEKEERFVFNFFYIFLFFPSCFFVFLSTFLKIKLNSQENNNKSVIEIIIRYIILVIVNVFLAIIFFLFTLTEDFSISNVIFN
jgi:hypothetical protein